MKSEVGQVTLHQSWHNPMNVPLQVINNYRNVLKLENWDQSLLEMAKCSEFSSNYLYFHECLYHLNIPVFILHGDDDKLVDFRESVVFGEYFQCCEVIKLGNCGHMPHEEIPHVFVRHVLEICNQQNLENFNCQKKA